MPQRKSNKAAHCTINPSQNHPTTDLHVALHEEEIGGSPFRFSVFPDVPVADHCEHSLANTYWLDTSSAEEKDRTLALEVFPIDQFNNTIAEATVFQVKITFGDEELFKDYVRSGVTEKITIPKGAAGEIKFIIALKGYHIKGSPHYIEAFVPRSEELDGGTIVKAVLWGGAFLFLSFIVYKAATKKGRENVMDEVTEARKCLLPLVLDLVDVATDAGE